MTVEIYSDIACPWCYVGHRRFSMALAELPPAGRPEVVFRPYQLDPTLRHIATPLKDHLRRRYGAQADAMIRQVTRTAATEGLDLRFDRAQAVNTLTAHRLLQLALDEHGPETQRTLIEKLFEAHFTKGENVGSPELLADLAADVEMDRESTVQYLLSDDGKDQVRRAISYAQQLGIRAVPTFVFDGRYAVQGAQSTDSFRQVLDEIESEADAS